MIFTTLLIAAVGVTTVGILSYFWDDIKNWLHSVVQKLKRAVKGFVAGVKVFAKKMREAFQEIAKTYHQDERGAWHETTVTKTIPASEVPPEILAKAKYMNKEVDITEELEQELKLVV